MNRLHQDLKRAQAYSAITTAVRAGCSSLVESVVLANSIKQDEFLALTAAKNDVSEDIQMALCF